MESWVHSKWVIHHNYLVHNGHSKCRTVEIDLLQKTSGTWIVPLRKELFSSSQQLAKLENPFPFLFFLYFKVVMNIHT